MFLLQSNKFIYSIHKKNGFAEVSKNLDRYRSKIIFIRYQNNYDAHKQYCEKFLTF